MGLSESVRRIGGEPRGTRGYLERICFQVNGCFEQGWFDGCAVMMRRLVETLLIEAFEHHKIDSKVKHPTTGDFLHLRDLIDRALQEPSWNLTRVTKTALPRLKSLGDQSAHSRRYNARREDIDRVSNEFRVCCEEFLYLAGLR